ncbi:MAG: hypothetical protein CMN77_04630 [Spirochaetaceae bacterium]|nr:hypothetical protein [Spirochaetaceae bacterium]|tara:strand:+ start:18181 stop:22008 length:3828 start_codon:yes stop_codon:yes gene_type:complete
MSDSTFFQSATRVLKENLPMARKSLIIGMGGSGMKGILSARSQIEREMPSEARTYMRWIGIDTTDIGTSIEGKGESYRFPGNEQHFQEDRRMLYIGAPTPSELSLSYLKGLRENDPAYKWLPDPDIYRISTRSGQGANQTRALGRLAFFHNYEKIRSALVAEKERLEAMSNDPAYFRLMDVQEKSAVEVLDLDVELKPGKVRYHFSDYVPGHNDILDLELDEETRTILCPHIPLEKISPEIFPRDDKGYYFEINPERTSMKHLGFQIKHAPREGQISIFLTASVVGGTGNGMLLDMAAMIHDIFKDTWPAPKLYGIIVLPSAFKRVVYNQNARANAYAALKELDYFQSGNAFEATYPNGRHVKLEDRLFKDGMLYLLDVENLSGNILQDRDQVQELTGQFIHTFVSSTVGGAIEERMVNDSTRASIYFPEDGSEPARRASYNSFGISRVMYPVPILREVGFKLAALRIIKRFHEKVDQKLLNETFGDLNRGLVRALRLNCALIFERMYPDYRLDWKAEFNGYRDRIQRSMRSGDRSGVVSILELMRRDYGRGEMEHHKDRLLRRMESRWRLELEKVQQVMEEAVAEITADPSRGFLFTRALLDRVMERLEFFQGLCYESRVGLNYYADSEIEEQLRALDTGDFNAKRVEAVYTMIRLNHLQLIHESMLQATEEFLREFKGSLYQLRNETLAPLEDRLQTLAHSLHDEIQKSHFELLQKKNPLFFYLVNKPEIKGFINRHFGARLSLDDLCNEVDFLGMDRGDDTTQIVQTYLMGRFGLEVLERSQSEMEELIHQELGLEILQKSPEEAREILYGQQGDDRQWKIDEATMNRIEVDRLRAGLFQVIQKRFAGFSFENLSIQDVLREKKIELKSLLTKLDTYSRPYTSANFNGLRSMEYFRAVTQFPLNVFEEGDSAPERAQNDLPPRMDHYTKRSTVSPNISVECFEVPNLVKPYEIISMGIVLGFPLFRVNGLNDCVNDYHDLMHRREHPLHLFNNPSFDAKYFPDPYRTRNYLNPKQLWNGLLEFQLLEKKAGGYEYAESIHDGMRQILAGETYSSGIRKLMDEVQAGGGLEKISPELFARCLAGPGILKKNKDGQIYFRKEYDLIIRDILDGDGTGQRASEANLTKEQYLEQKTRAVYFKGMGDLVKFVFSNAKVKSFLLTDLQRIFQDTRGSQISGAAVQIPRSKLASIKLHSFKDEFQFYDYFQTNGSLAWQDFLKNEIVQKVDSVLRTYRHPQDPTLPDRARMEAYLEERKDSIPFVALWELKVKHGVIR